MPDPRHRRPNHVEIDPESVTRRVASLRRRLGRRVRIFAALKADGYGFGTLPMAQAALAGGADALALIDRAEALMLREARIDVPILLYAGSPIDAEAVTAAEARRLILTVLSERQIEFVSQQARSPVELAIKVEVGAERIGVLPDELLAMAQRIAKQRILSLEVVNTHPTFGDDAPDNVVKAQFQRFTASGRPAANGRPAASDAAVRVIQDTGADHGDGTRCHRSRAVPVRRCQRTADHPLTANRADPGEAGDTGLRAGICPVRSCQGAARRCHAVRQGGWRWALSRQRSPGPGQACTDPRRTFAGIHAPRSVGDEDADEGDEVVLIGRQGTAQISLAEVCAAEAGDAIGYRDGARPCRPASILRVVVARTRVVARRRVDRAAAHIRAVAAGRGA